MGAEPEQEPEPRNIRDNEVAGLATVLRWLAAHARQFPTEGTIKIRQIDAATAYNALPHGQSQQKAREREALPAQRR